MPRPYKLLPEWEGSREGEAPAIPLYVEPQDSSGVGGLSREDGALP